MSLGTILLIILGLMLLGAIPAWPHESQQSACHLGRKNGRAHPLCANGQTVSWLKRSSCISVVSRERLEMKTDARSSEPTAAEFRQILDGATEFNEEVGAEDAARAAQNILQWTSYLPSDCINAMIAMGWDRTT